MHPDFSAAKIKKKCANYVSKYGSYQCFKEAAASIFRAEDEGSYPFTRQHGVHNGYPTFLWQWAAPVTVGCMWINDSKWYT
jgi:hypothetical protein